MRVPSSTGSLNILWGFIGGGVGWVQCGARHSYDGDNDVDDGLVYDGDGDVEHDGDDDDNGWRRWNRNARLCCPTRRARCGRSVAPSLRRSVAQSLSRSAAQSLSRSVAQSLSRSVARSLDRSVAQSRKTRKAPANRMLPGSAPWRGHSSTRWVSPSRSITSDTYTNPATLLHGNKRAKLRWK